MNLPITVTQDDLLEILLNVAPSRPVFIWGAPGIGKSALVEQFAVEIGLPCVSLLGSQLAPEDIIGIPQIKGETSEFLPPKMIARKEPYVLFLDELNACSQEVQKAFYSLIHERRIGEYHLPEGSIVVGAGNRIQDSAIVKTMSSALINRMFHVQMKADARQWIKWAQRSQLHPWVIDYIIQRPDHLFSEAPKTEEPFSTPRSWHMLSDALTEYGAGKRELSSHVLKMLVYGCLTPSHAGGHDASKKKDTVISKASEWFLSHYPLLGGLASSFKIIEDIDLCRRYEIHIAAVDAVHGEIYTNPSCCLTLEEWKFVLAHEYLHAGLCHHERCQGRNHYLWNIACDYVINDWLLAMHIGSMPEEDLLYDESLHNMSAEAIYDLIVKKMRKFKKHATFRGYGKGDLFGDQGPRFEGLHKGISLDEFFKNSLREGLDYHTTHSRGYLPAGLIEEIRALSMPSIPWEVQLGRWFDEQFPPLEKHRTYVRPSRRQGSTPNIPRPSYMLHEKELKSRTFGVVIDTSGSMCSAQIGLALGAAASYAAAKDVPFVRIIFCDAEATDAGYMAPEDIAGRVEITGRGGTILQPGIDALEKAKDFPPSGPILVITDGYIEDNLKIRRKHAFLIPNGNRLPFRPKGKVFYMENKEKQAAQSALR